MRNGIRGVLLVAGDHPNQDQLLSDAASDTALALEAARLSGRFATLPGAEDRTARREALREAVRLDAEIARLRAAAARQRQVARQVEMNLELKRAEAARTAVLERL